MASTKRLRQALRDAITDIVVNGLTTAEAAEKHGYTLHSLQQALKKPHVRSFRQALSEAHLSGVGEEAVAVMVGLMHKAKSESVRLEAAKHVAALAGIKPKEEVTHHHNHEIRAGWVIQLPPLESDGMKTIDAASETSNDLPALTDGSSQSDQ